jgi:flagellar export protein FliJ
MARFKFKLDRLLRVREVSEELARAEFGSAELAAQRAREGLDGARADLLRAERELIELRTRDGALAALAAEKTLPALLQRIAVRRQRLVGAEAAATAARNEWQARRTDVRALEKLEDRAREVFAVQEREREDRALQETIERRAALGARTTSSSETKA